MLLCQAVLSVVSVILGRHRHPSRQPVRQLARRNIGVLITDHNVRETFGIIDRGYIMNEGTLLVSGTPEELSKDEQARKVYLGETFAF